MGKIRRERNKLHLSTKQNQETQNNTNSSDDLQNTPGDSPNVSFSLSDNLFSGIKIDVRSLNKLTSEDTVSIKSFKSIKSQVGTNKISKKEKMKLRKQLLLQKIDTVQQLKKEAALQKKRKNTPIIGDTMSLREALPDLESLLNSSSEDKPRKKDIKNKAIKKEAKRKKDMVKNMQIYKQLMNNPEVKKNTLETISEHIKAISESKQL